jgi:S1-C subfamily serine protease
MSSGWRISLLQGSQATRMVAVPPEGLTLGRSSKSDVVLAPDEHPGVSAQHARVSVNAGELELEDLGSRNGTLVDGEPVTRARLGHGRVFELGPQGPRFVVLAEERLDETITLPRSLAGRLGAEGGKRSLGTQTMYLLREKLGIPEGRGVDELVTHRSRRTLYLTVLLIVLVAAGASFATWRWMQREHEELLSLRAATDARLAQATQELEEQRRAWTRQERELESARIGWEEDRRRLEQERAELLAHIGELEEAGVSHKDELARLKLELGETSKTLALYDPINLEQARLGQVRRYVASVVLIEARMLLREETSGRVLHIMEGTNEVNLEERGVPLEESGTGSGFCVSPEGWIVTNAHVVFKDPGVQERIPINEHETLVAERELFVTFSGSDQRHPARLVSWVRDAREDLALVKIEAFEGMPHLAEIDLDQARPAPGSDVYMIGFPGGKDILQEGDRVVASTFRGIVSRSVDYYLQIDAAVHPGVSGGPVIDDEGELVGVVTAMQVLNPAASSSEIGYVIPIHEVSKVWPPAPAPIEAGTGPDAGSVTPAGGK